MRGAINSDGSKIQPDCPLIAMVGDEPITGANRIRPRRQIADLSIVARGRGGVTGDPQEVHKGSPLPPKPRRKLGCAMQLRTKTEAIPLKS